MTDQEYHRIYMRAYYAKNRDTILAKQRQRYHEDPERRRYHEEYRKAYKEAHREELKEYARRYHQAHKLDSEYLAKNAERHAKWLNKNRERFNAYQREYQKKKAEGRTVQ